MKQNIPAVLMSCVFAWLIVNGVPHEPRDSVSPEEQASGWAQVGDVISVFPDDKISFGKQVMIPPSEGGKFWRIHVANLSVEEAKSLTVPGYDRNGKLVNYRKWKLDIPENIASELYLNGAYYTTRNSTFLSYIKER